MASNKYRYPPAPPNARGTFSDNLVGLQFHEGGELTQANFEFTTKVVERVVRTFDNGTFSDPLSLNDINITDISQFETIFSQQFTAIPNFDKSNVTNFALYGSTQKRFSKAISKIINFFPAGIEVNKLYYDYTTGKTAYDVVYLPTYDVTTFKINVNRFKNPFGIDYTTQSSINIKNKENEVSEIRDLTNNFSKYSVFLGENEYPVVDFEPSSEELSGYVTFEVEGEMLPGQLDTEETILIRPNDNEVDAQYKNNFDEVEEFFVNRKIRPKYTSVFQVIKEGESGKLYKTEEKIKWPIDGLWNLDIRSESFDRYLNKLNKISFDLDEFKTNLITRFLTAGTLKDFDTKDQKFEKILQLYGRNFDEIKKYIDALSHINSVNYKVKDDIPSELLKDLVTTLGWNNNISPIINESLLESIISGEPINLGTLNNSPNEVSNQYYRNLILNSAYLFKSKGTLRAIRSLLDIVGIPRPMVEINELVYIASGPLNTNIFNNLFSQISGGTKIESSSILDTQNTTNILGIPYANTTTVTNYYNVDNVIEDYPIDENGYPTSPIETEDMFFQKGAGWYKSTPQHRSIEIVNETDSVFTGQNVDIQTTLEPFTYGEKYLDVFRNFPNLGIGFNIAPVKDNKKSWVVGSDKNRFSENAGLNASYYVEDERLVINCKNLDISLNMGMMITYDLWNLSNNGNITSIDSGRTAEPNLDKVLLNNSEEDLINFNNTFYNSMINVRTRMYDSSSMYPLLYNLFYEYKGLQLSQSYSYQKTIDYTNGIGDYWMRLIEQLVPATTLWTGGQKFDNSTVHRQKLTWRRQRKHYDTDVITPPSYYSGTIYDNSCEYTEIVCDITYNTQQTDIINVINDTVSGNGYIYGDCDTSTTITEWIVIVKINDVVEYEGTPYYNGAGVNDYPSQTQWNTAVDEAFNNINTYNISHTIENNQITIFNVDCRNNLLGDSVSIESKINLSINCE